MNNNNKIRTFKQFIVQALVLSLMWSGCYLTREPIRYRDVYFRPVSTQPLRSQSKLSSTEVNHLKKQLEAAAEAATKLRDSLAALQQFSGSLLTSTRALVDKVSELETKEYLTTSKQKDLEQRVTILQSENKQISQQLTELRAKVFADNANPKQSVFSPAHASTSLRDEYTEGVSLFQQRQYEDAYTTFSRLLDKGIDDDLADNCEYWIGECNFAKREYSEAIKAFQRVLTIKSSNKIIDAYFMMGKSYELIGVPVKARWAYEELSLLYPDNPHARIVKSRLNVLKQNIPTQKKNKLKNPTA